MATLSPELLKLVKKSQAKHTRTGDSVQLKEGSTTIQILAKGDGQFWRDFAVHWIKTEKGGKPVAVVGCNDKTYDQPCEVCNAIAAATEACVSDEEMELIKEWKAKAGVLVNALILTGSQASADPQIVDLRPTVWSEIAGTIALYQDEGVDVLDPKDGICFIVERRGKGFDTKYSVKIAPKKQPFNPEVLDRLHDLDAYITSQYFRGDERKALTAIANVTGVSVNNPALAAPMRSPMLTKPATVVPDAEVEAAVEAVIEAEATEVAEVVEVEEAAAETDEERELREFREFQAAKKAAAAAKPAAATPAATTRTKPVAAKPAAKQAAAAKPVAAEDDSFNSDLAQDEIDNLLSELEGVGK